MPPSSALSTGYFCLERATVHRAGEAWRYFEEHKYVEDEDGDRP